jgi:hypothetical protein
MGAHDHWNAHVRPSVVRAIEEGRPFAPEAEHRVKAAFAAADVEITNGEGTGARLVFAQGPA